MNELIKNNNKIHTTILGKQRIKKNLNIDGDVIKYCRNIILNKNCKIIKKGKNYYCKIDDICLTINIYSYTIITARRY